MRSQTGLWTNIFLSSLNIKSIRGAMSRLAMVFPVVMCGMWEVDHKAGWALKNWCFQTVVLEKTLESPLDSKEIKLVNSKGNQPWIFIGRTDAEAKAPILWPPDAKDPDAGKDGGQEEKWAREDEMVGWQHQFNGHEFEQTWGDSEGQGSLAFCSPWCLKALDTTDWLNNNKSSSYHYKTLKTVFKKC